MTTNNLNTAVDNIDAEEEVLLKQLAALKAKKLAAKSLESEYTATIEHVKATGDLMIAAGLDPRTLLKDLSALYAPVNVQSTRGKKSDGTNTDKNDNSKLNRPSPDSKGGKSWAICDRLLLQYGDIEQVKGAEVGRLALEEHDDKYGSWHCNNWKQAQKLAAAPVVTPAPIESEPTPAPVIVPPKPPIESLTEINSSALDKKIEAEIKKSSAKKVK